MTLKERYIKERQKPTAPQLFIEEVADVTKRSTTTVRMWMSGAQAPDALTQQVLADHFGTTPEQLFPSAVSRQRETKGKNNNKKI